MATFEELGIHPKLVKAINELGFEQPMPIQEQVIPTVLESERDIIGLAQTGTGKTAAFGLPLIQHIDLEFKSIQAIILSPTRELCLQITNDLTNYAKYIKGIKICPVYGGADIVKQMKELQRGVHIVVATPGRMNDLLNKRNKMDVSDVRIVVLDEADEMLSMGFKDDLDAILAQTSSFKTTLLFSATMPKEVRQISKNYMHDPVEISVGERNTGADNVRHICYRVQEKNRYLALKRVVDFFPNIYGIIFCRTREETKQVAKKLMQDGYNADALHGDLSQAQREAVMHKFRIKNITLLTATDVAARGLDVKDLTHIINYNLPDEAVVYIHRSGRTGRAGQKGVSIAITNMREKHKIEQIECLQKKKFKLKSVPTGREICEKQLLDIVDRLQQIEVNDADIESYLPAVHQKLASLSREELIKHFVAMEFNQFLNYYKDADELIAPEENDRSRSGKKSKRERPNYDQYIPVAENGFTRFYINLGERDKITPPEMIGLIVRATRQRGIDVGKIDILRKFSFFEVDEHYTEAVLNGFRNMTHNKHNVVVEISQPTDKPSVKRFPGNRNDRGPQDRGKHRRKSNSKIRNNAAQTNR
ncbi:DEAD/DEAH box helicase [candidate division KSB1 bacterium]|nr:DEAD/DEAH box helicase [candidate division KSB1 bacterium]